MPLFWILYGFLFDVYVLPISLNTFVLGITNHFCQPCPTHCLRNLLHMFIWLFIIDCSLTLYLIQRMKVSYLSQLSPLSNSYILTCQLELTETLSIHSALQFLANGCFQCPWFGIKIFWVLFFLDFQLGVPEYVENMCCIVSSLYHLST